MHQTVPFTATRRACLSCGEPLEKYHRGDYCKTCQAKDAKPDALDARIAVAAQEFGYSPQAPRPERDNTSTPPEPKAPALLPGFKLTPVAALPGKPLTGWGRMVIEAFLDSGTEVARVDTPNKSDGKVQCTLAKIIRRTPEFNRRCYAATRGGVCYLVRVRPTESSKKG